jgi:hypothetical protein
MGISIEYFRFDPELEMEIEALDFAARKNTRWESRTAKVWCFSPVALLWSGSAVAWRS